MDLCTLCASPASVKDHEPTGRLYCGWHALHELRDYPAVYFDLYYVGTTEPLCDRPSPISRLTAALL